jgi:hypothetical protein
MIRVSRGRAGTALLRSEPSELQAALRILKSPSSSAAIRIGRLFVPIWVSAAAAALESPTWDSRKTWPKAGKASIAFVPIALIACNATCLRMAARLGE